MRRLRPRAVIGGLLVGLTLWLGILYGLYGMEPPTLLPPGFHPWPSPRIEAEASASIHLAQADPGPLEGIRLTPPAISGARTIFPGGLGLGEGGTPLAVAVSPRGRIFGLHIQAPSPREGGWMEGDTLVTAPLVLSALSTTYTYAISLPTSDVLLASVRTASEAGIAVRALHEVDLGRPDRIVTLTRDLFYTHAQWSRPGGPSLALWGEGRRWVGINREVPLVTRLRLYPREPLGGEAGFNALRVPALAGQVLRGTWIDDRTFVFVTARTFGPRARRGERGWVLTLPAEPPNTPSSEREP